VKKASIYGWLLLNCTGSPASQNVWFPKASRLAFHALKGLSLQVFAVTLIYVCMIESVDTFESWIG